MGEYRIEDLGNKRILIIDNQTFETVYSKKVIELIIKRKGLQRTPEYLVHKEKRSYLFKPLFNYLDSHGIKNLKVLEVGCSAGQITELLNEQDCISEIYTYDIDSVFVEVTKAKVEDLGLLKVKRVDCFTTLQTTALPYQDNYFDLIILSGVVEHLPFESRFLYVDEYYRKLKIGGLLCFLDIPNRGYPFESHSIGLPFINRLTPQVAFIYAKLFGKLKGVDFAEFVRPGTAWRNASYYECLPHTLTAVVKDISEEIGYGYTFFKKTPMSIKFKIFVRPIFGLLLYISKKLDFPISFYLPHLNVIFRKVKNLEK